MIPSDGASHVDGQMEQNKQAHSKYVLDFVINILTIILQKWFHNQLIWAVTREKLLKNAL